MAGSDNPFVNADAWRKHPLLNNTWRHIAPGFFIGLTAFGVFYAYDKATAKKTAKH
ncbi:NADH dehydrogenase [ubiquinone] 1 beta subcomplex subunit 3 [bacterium]|nr:NADH dehydrogenase [ubiquinone] 1 beta subcomplex subunit 3 [bacterium]